MYTHILVPTDGSELAQNGVNQALTLAKALGSKVTVITATEPFPIMYGEGWAPSAEDYKQYELANSESTAKLLAKVKSQAEKLGVTAETLHVPNRNAATAIIETAKSRNCNLIVMSSHGRRGIVRAIMGSQTAEVLAHSPIPVLVIR